MNFIIDKLIQQNNLGNGFELVIENFIFKDWNVFYNLFNVENFEDPENHPKWYKSTDVYKNFEIPITDSEEVLIYSSDKILDFKTITDLIDKATVIENEILVAVVHYTFGNGGAYAEAKHFEFAKKTMELLHRISLTDKEFIKRNLRINTIMIGDETDELELHFDCGWDEEHGLKILLKKSEIISIE